MNFMTAIFILLLAICLPTIVHLQTEPMPPRPRPLAEPPLSSGRPPLRDEILPEPLLPPRRDRFPDFPRGRRRFRGRRLRPPYRRRRPSRRYSPIADPYTPPFSSYRDPDRRGRERRPSARRDLFDRLLSPPRFRSSSRDRLRGRPRPLREYYPPIDDFSSRRSFREMPSYDRTPYERYVPADYEDYPDSMDFRGLDRFTRPEMFAPMGRRYRGIGSSTPRRFEGGIGLRGDIPGDSRIDDTFRPYEEDISRGFIDPRRGRYLNEGLRDIGTSPVEDYRLFRPSLSRDSLDDRFISDRRSILGSLRTPLDRMRDPLSPEIGPFGERNDMARSRFMFPEMSGIPPRQMGPTTTTYLDSKNANSTNIASIQDGFISDFTSKPSIAMGHTIPGLNSTRVVQKPDTNQTLPSIETVLQRLSVDIDQSVLAKINGNPRHSEYTPSSNDVSHKRRQNNTATSLGQVGSGRKQNFDVTNMLQSPMPKFTDVHTIPVNITGRPIGSANTFTKTSPGSIQIPLPFGFNLATSREMIVDLSKGIKGIANSFQNGSANLKSILSRGALTGQKSHQTQRVPSLEQILSQNGDTSIHREQSTIGRRPYRDDPISDPLYERRHRDHLPAFERTYNGKSSHEPSSDRIPENTFRRRQDDRLPSKDSIRKSRGRSRDRTLHTEQGSLPSIERTVDRRGSVDLPRRSLSPLDSHSRDRYIDIMPSERSLDRHVTDESPRRRPSSAKRSRDIHYETRSRERPLSVDGSDRRADYRPRRQPMSSERRFRDGYTRTPSHEIPSGDRHDTSELPRRRPSPSESHARLEYTDIRVGKRPFAVEQTAGRRDLSELPPRRPKLSERPPRDGYPEIPIHEIPPAVERTSGRRGSDEMSRGRISPSERPPRDDIPSRDTPVTDRRITSNLPRRLPTPSEASFRGNLDDIQSRDIPFEDRRSELPRRLAPVSEGSFRDRYVDIPSRDGIRRSNELPMRLPPVSEGSSRDTSADIPRRSDRGNTSERPRRLPPAPEGSPRDIYADIPPRNDRRLTSEVARRLPSQEGSIRDRFVDIPPRDIPYEDRRGTHSPPRRLSPASKGPSRDRYADIPARERPFEDRRGTSEQPLRRTSLSKRPARERYVDTPPRDRSTSVERTSRIEGEVISPRRPSPPRGHSSDEYSSLSTSFAEPTPLTSESRRITAARRLSSSRESSDLRGKEVTRRRRPIYRRPYEEDTLVNSVVDRPRLRGPTRRRRPSTRRLRSNETEIPYTESRQEPIPRRPTLHSERRTPSDEIYFTTPSTVGLPRRRHLPSSRRPYSSEGSSLETSEPTRSRRTRRRRPISRRRSSYVETPSSGPYEDSYSLSVDTQPERPYRADTVPTRGRRLSSTSTGTRIPRRRSITPRLDSQAKSLPSKSEASSDPPRRSRIPSTGDHRNRTETLTPTPALSHSSPVRTSPGSHPVAPSARHPGTGHIVPVGTIQIGAPQPPQQAIQGQFSYKPTSPRRTHVGAQSVYNHRMRSSDVAVNPSPSTPTPGTSPYRASPENTQGLDQIIGIRLGVVRARGGENGFPVHGGFCPGERCADGGLAAGVANGTGSGTLDAFLERQRTGVNEDITAFKRKLGSVTVP